MNKNNNITLCNILKGTNIILLKFMALLVALCMISGVISGITDILGKV